MARNTYQDRVEIFKFRETGALALFDEVEEFMINEKINYGRRWEITDLYSDMSNFYARLKEVIEQ